MKNYLVLLWTLSITASCYSQEKILGVYSFSDFEPIDWLQDLDDHMRIGTLQGGFVEQLDSIVWTDLTYIGWNNIDESNSIKRAYYFDNKTEIQASYVWNDDEGEEEEWRHTFFRKYKYGGAGGRLSECSFHYDWDGTIGDWDSEPDVMNKYNYDNEGRLSSIEYDRSGSSNPEAIGTIEIYNYEEDKIIEAILYNVHQDGSLHGSYETKFHYENGALLYVSTNLWYPFQERWIPDDSIAYSYNQEGALYRRDYYFAPLNESPRPIESYEYHYHDDGRPDRIYHYDTYNPSVNEFRSKSFIEYKYQDSGSLESQSIYGVIVDTDEQSEFPAIAYTYVSDESVSFSQVRYPRNVLYEESGRDLKHKITRRESHNGLDWSDLPPIKLGVSHKHYYYSPSDGTASEEIAEVEDWQVYPNPARDQVTISSAIASVSQGSWAFELYDKGGRRVMQVAIVSSLEKVNLSRLAAGLYYYKISDGDKVIHGSVVKVD